MFVRKQIAGQIVNRDKHLAVFVFLDPEGQFPLLDSPVKLAIGDSENFSGGDEADSLPWMEHRPDPGGA